jgi:hypothetical protein
MEFSDMALRHKTFASHRILRKRCVEPKWVRYETTRDGNRFPSWTYHHPQDAIINNHDLGASSMHTSILEFHEDYLRTNMKIRAARWLELSLQKCARLPAKRYNLGYSEGWRQTESEQTRYYIRRTS